MEWYELMFQYVTPYLAAFIGGYLASEFYSRYRTAKLMIGGLLFILRKLHNRGVWLTPYDMAVINVAIDFHRGRK